MFHIHSKVIHWITWQGEVTYDTSWEGRSFIYCLCGYTVFKYRFLHYWPRDNKFIPELDNAVLLKINTLFEKQQRKQMSVWVAKPWTVQWVMDLLQIKDCTGHVTLSINKFEFGAVLETGLNEGKRLHLPVPLRSCRAGDQSSLQRRSDSVWTFC